MLQAIFNTLVFTMTMLVNCQKSNNYIQSYLFYMILQQGVVFWIDIRNVLFESDIFIWV